MSQEKTADLEQAHATQERPVDGILKTNITTEMQKAYLDYAMSVIVSRALPDVRDGLKPVQRRIIYAMQDQGMTATSKFHKCAAVVGEVLKMYHPHGDISVYDALVRMAQDFTLRYPLIIPQGNFGSIDNDPPAAMRYTECKLDRITEELYKDIKSETVEFGLNDLQNYEPAYMPSLLPNLLLNGASGIAVGMATNIPPHNLNEVVDAISHMIDNVETAGTPPTDENILHLNYGYSVKVAKTDFNSSDTVENLVEFIKGPDFPTGGIIYDQKEIMQMYATGRGRVVTRAKIETETQKDRTRLIVTEIPYQVTKSTLVSKIADLVKNKKIVGISDLRDESSRKGMRILIELKKDAIVKKIQNQLYKYTQLQNAFNTNMVALLDNEPKLMTLKMVLEEFVKHRQQIVVKRTIFLLKKAKDREHILLGLKIALDHIEEIIKLIRASKDADAAKTDLMEKFGFTEIQAQAILDMQLRKLAALERKKIEDELAELVKTINGFEILLASPKLILETVRKELIDVKERYGDERKTRVIKGKLGELEDEDLIPNEKAIITISATGYIKRQKEDAYKKQGRGGKGVKGQELKDDDYVDTIRYCNTHDYALFFTNKGRAYKLRVWEIPEFSKQAKGTAIVNFLNISGEERVEAFIVVSAEELASEEGYLMFCTRQGVVKKTAIKEYENIRSSGIIAIKLDDNDMLTWVNYCTDQDEVVLATSKGMSIRFEATDVRPMGRVSAGVRGVKLSKTGDKVVGMVVVPQKSTQMSLMIVSEHGYGKKTEMDEYKVQNRGGSGILTYKVTDKTGDLVAARHLHDDKKQDILIATLSGKFIRLAQKQVPTLSRATQGVKLISMDKDDSVTSVAILEDEVLDEEIPSIIE